MPQDFLMRFHKFLSSTILYILVVSTLNLVIAGNRKCNSTNFQTQAHPVKLRSILRVDNSNNVSDIMKSCDRIPDRVVHGSGRPAGRVGSGHHFFQFSWVGSGRVRSFPVNFFLPHNHNQLIQVLTVCY
jgi:hypothetical protein